MPPISGLSAGLTIGIQTIEGKPVKRKGGARYRYKATRTAKVLFSQGCGLPRPFDYTIPRNVYTARAPRFRPVCDPIYHIERQPWQLGETAELPDIEIEPPRGVANDHAFTPYDLGCELHASELPTGKVRFTLSGESMRHLVEGRIDAAIVDDSFPIVLGCFRIDSEGEMMKDTADRKFLLNIIPDPASRFPIVANEQDLMTLAVPFWCSLCDKEIVMQGARCDHEL